MFNCVSVDRYVGTHVRIMEVGSTLVSRVCLPVTSQEDDGVSNSGVDVEVLQDPAAIDEWSYDDGSEIRLFAGSW